MKINEIAESLKTATPEELAELRNLFWDREIEHAAASGKLSEAVDKLSRAKHLESIWIERETKQRQIAQDASEQNEAARYRHYGAAAEATKNCRLDLQWEFELVRRLGSGPMTDAEAWEYRAQEEAP